MLSACNLLKNNINDPKALTSKDMVSVVIGTVPRLCGITQCTSVGNVVACPSAVAGMLLPELLISI